MIGLIDFVFWLLELVIKLALWVLWALCWVVAIGVVLWIFSHMPVWAALIVLMYFMVKAGK